MASTATVATRPRARVKAIGAGGDVHLRQQPAAEDVAGRVGVGRHGQRPHRGLQVAQVGHRAVSGATGIVAARADGSTSANSAPAPPPPDLQPAAELLRQGQRDPHARGRGCRLADEAGRQARPVVGHREPDRRPRPSALESHPDGAGRAFRVGVLGGVGDQLGEDEGDRDGAVGRHRSARAAVGLDPAVGRATRARSAQSSPR